MRLKYLIFVSTMLLFSIVIAGNAWHLAKLTDVTSAKLGEAAFNVSKSTVESVLAQRLNSGLIFIEQQLSEIQKLTSERDSQEVSQDTPHTKSTDSQPLNRVHLQTQDFNFEQSIDLKLNDSAESRSIEMFANDNLYEIPIPRTEMEESIAQASNAIIITSIASFVFALVFVLLVSDRITRPLANICRVSHKIGSGDFTETVPTLSKYSSIEMKELVNSINKMSKQLQRLEQEKESLQEQQKTSEISEISRGLAHSIRNPLHTLQLAVETQSDNENLTKQVKKQVQRIDHHIRELMTITTHDALSAEPVDLVELVDSIVQENQHRLPVKLIHSLNNLDDRKVRMVESELRSCIATLINNAVEACDTNSEGEVIVQLECKKKDEDSNWRITVSDTGKGLSSRIKEKLFRPHNTDKPHGAGMGLYIAQRIIVGRYSGNIQYKPNVLSGSTFTMTLNHRTQ